MIENKSVLKLTLLEVFNGVGYLGFHGALGRLLTYLYLLKGVCTRYLDPPGGVEADKC